MQVTARGLFWVRSARRVIITLAILLVYVVGFSIPLPGVDTKLLMTLGSGSWSKVSLMALGIMPWVSACALAEAIRLVAPRGINLPFVRDNHADPFSPWIMGLALLLGAYQAFGLSISLQAMSSGPDMQAAVMASLIGGLAFTMALGVVVTRLGVGGGFWVLWSVILASSIGTDVGQLVTMARQGFIPLAQFLVLGALMLGMIVGLVALTMARADAGLRTIEPLVWPIYVYYLVAPWAAPVWELMFSVAPIGRSAENNLMPNTLLGACLAIVVVVLISIRSGELRQHALLGAATILGIAVCLIGPELTMNSFLWPIPGAQLLVIVAVTTTMLTTMRRPQQ